MPAESLTHKKKKPNQVVLWISVGTIDAERKWTGIILKETVGLAVTV